MSCSKQSPLSMHIPLIRNNIKGLQRTTYYINIYTYILCIYIMRYRTSPFTIYPYIKKRHTPIPTERWRRKLAEIFKLEYMLPAGSWLAYRSRFSCPFKYVSVGCITVRFCISVGSRDNMQWIIFNIYIAIYTLYIIVKYNGLS